MNAFEAASSRRNFLTGMMATAGSVTVSGCAGTFVRTGEVADGWIDLQVNGRVGIDFMRSTLTVGEVRRVVDAMRAGGTTGFLATICSTTDANVEHSLRVIAEARRRDALCRETILGAHLEGPFLSPVDGFSGTHPHEFLRDPDIGAFERWQDVSDGLIRLITIAGERKGAEAFVRRATEMKVVVSLGHTAMWKTEDLDRMARAGAKALTHLGNGLPNELPRHRNLMWTGLAHPALAKMFIADGFHLPREVLKVFVRSAPIDKLVVVSDCAYPGGLPPGTYRGEDGECVLEPSGFLRCPRSNSLYGSSCLMADCVRVLNSLEVGLSMSECARLCRDNPLELLQLV